MDHGKPRRSQARLVNREFLVRKANRDCQRIKERRRKQSRTGDKGPDAVQRQTARQGIMSISTQPRLPTIQLSNYQKAGVRVIHMLNLRNWTQRTSREECKQPNKGSTRLFLTCRVCYHLSCSSTKKSILAALTWSKSRVKWCQESLLQ